MNGCTDRRGTEAEVAEWRTRKTERCGAVCETDGGKGREGGNERERETEIEDEGRRERSRAEEEPGREKNDCFHDYNGERKRKRGETRAGGGMAPGKGVWGAIS